MSNLMPEWSTACTDWEDRIVKGKSLIPFPPLFPDYAEQALDVMKRLRLVDVPDSPMIGECCAQWMFDFAGAIFGAYEEDTGRRHIKEFFLQVPKKNGKALALSTLIPVPSGWSTMGDLQVGDQVFGTDGQPCNVIAISDIFTDHKCYELEFSNGEKVVADAGHRWVTQIVEQFDEEFVVTTQNIADSLQITDFSGKKIPNHSVAGDMCRVDIISAVEVPPVPVKCISVDAPNKQFLFGKTMLPTHNSSISASIMLTALILNWRQSAELIILAPTHEIAMNAYAPARDMVNADEELKSIFKVQDHIKTITHMGTGASLKVVAADQNTVGGKKASIILIDEIHIFGKNIHAENMIREATGGMMSRPEGCIIYLTTQSDQPPAGVYLKKLKYARKVRDGVIKDNKFLSVIYEFPKKMIDSGECLDPKNFPIVHPNWGLSVDAESLIRDFDKAKIDGEESMLGFKAKYLNIQVGQNLYADRWPGADFWEQNGDPTLTLDALIEKSEVITIGIDGGGLDDLLALCVLGRDKEDPRIWYCWVHAWAHPSVLKRRQEVAPAIIDFSDAGNLTLVDRVGDDVIDVANIVVKVWESELLDRIGVDPIGISSILDELENRDIPKDIIVGIKQGYHMTGAVKTTERKLAAGELKHSATGLMAWSTGNAKIVQSGNAVLISKQVSGSAKIDPVMSLVDAVSLMGMNPEAKTAKYQMIIM